MKKKLVTSLALMLSATMMFAACGTKSEETVDTAVEAETEVDDQAMADNCAALIDAIYVQERTDKTDEQCKAAKEAWDALTDAQKELVLSLIHI